MRESSNIFAKNSRCPQGYLSSISEISMVGGKAAGASHNQRDINEGAPPVAIYANEFTPKLRHKALFSHSQAALSQPSTAGNSNRVPSFMAKAAAAGRPPCIAI